MTTPSKSIEERLSCIDSRLDDHGTRIGRMEEAQDATAVKLDQLISAVQGDRAETAKTTEAVKRLFDIWANESAQSQFDRNNLRGMCQKVDETFARDRDLREQMHLNDLLRTNLSRATFWVCVIGFFLILVLQLKLA